MQTSSHSLPQALPGERIDVDGQAGRLALYVAGAGAPMLLVHSVNAAASAAEVRPLFHHYAAGRRVYALDLPGFGSSDRSDRRYDARLMTDAVHAAVVAVRAREGARPLDGLAVSLGCEFLARAAAESPDAYRSLALVSPTGMNGRGEFRAPAGTPRGSARAYAWLRKPAWSGFLFRTLTRPAVIRYFLKRTWGSADIDEALWRYDVLTAQAPGAKNAPLYFLSGQLFSADIHTVYEGLRMPVWMSHGVRGDFTDYRQEALFTRRPNWSSTVYPTGALPYFEVTPRFCADYDAFLAAAWAQDRTGGDSYAR